MKSETPLYDEIEREILQELLEEFDETSVAYNKIKEKLNELD